MHPQLTHHTSHPPHTPCTHAHTRTHTHAHTHTRTTLTHTRTTLTHTHTQGTQGASLPLAEDLQYDVVGTAPRYTPSQKEKEEGKGKRKRQK